MSAFSPPRFTQSLDHAGLRQRARGLAGLAQLDADALDVADAEALADERVQVDAAREDVAARLGGADLDAVLGLQAFERLGLDQRERLARLRSVLEVVAVAGEPFAGVRRDAFDRRGSSLRRPDVDLARLCPAMRESLAAVPAAARRLDRHDVAGAQLGRDLRRQLAAVEEVASRRAVAAAVGSAWRARAALAQDREAAVLEHAQLAHDAVAAAVRAARRRCRAAARSARRAADTRARAPRPASSACSTSSRGRRDGPSASGHAPCPPPIVS